MKRSIHAGMFALLLGTSAVAAAADLSKPLMLVAKPELRDEVYGASVVVVAPIGGDQHIGFIVNRATDVDLASLFPDDEPSQKVADPVYLGGPFAPQAIFALMPRRERPGGKSFEVIPGLFAAFEESAIDDIIRSDPGHAKFVAGLVAWQAGELENEVKKGAWYVVEPDATLAMRKPDGLWDELVQRLKNKDNSI
jgi:putative transcriptional regulator